MKLFKEGKFDVIQDELYAADCESIEPADSVGEELTNAKGIDAIKEKGKNLMRLLKRCMAVRQASL